MKPPKFTSSPPQWKKTTAKDYKEIEKMNKKPTLKSLEKRIEWLESKIPEFITGATVSNVEFKIGDYVEFYDAEKVKHKGTIIEINEYSKKFHISCGIVVFVAIFTDIIGYAKPELLTQEEKEYLQAVIKPFRDEIKTIKYINSCFREPNVAGGKYYLDFGSDIGFVLFHKNNNLYIDKEYKLEELGI